MNLPAKPGYAPYWAFEVEGGRIALMTCLHCGGAVILDRDNAAERHDAWHLLVRSLYRKDDSEPEEDGFA